MTKPTATLGLEINEPLIFERSQSGAAGIDFLSDEASSQLSDREISEALQEFSGENDLLLPCLREPDAVRHFTRLSKKNFAIDVNSYPLGSCTMKYNPKIHEWVARLPGLSELHPYADEQDLQGAFGIMWELQTALSEIGGFYRTSLAPSAGAQGEFAGLAMIRKALALRGEKRTKILVPNSAHGTNPATAGFFGLDVVPIEADEHGRINLNRIEQFMDNQCVGLMVTNPNTLGIFENEIADIARLIHDRGGYVYGDGANLNALMGYVRPGDLGIDVMHFNLHKTMTTPHGGGGPGCGAIGASEELAAFLPTPLLEQKDGIIRQVTPENSIGRIRSFFGNFSMMIRAWVYIRSLGAAGLKEASTQAVLNANYVRKRLAPYYHIPFKGDCLHEVVLSDAWQMAHGVSALDICKRLIDYGIHPPTMYFPLVVKGALMIEPTETESLFDLDRLCDAFIAIAKEAQEDPNLVKNAPHHTALSRLDEALAARSPILTYQALRARHA